MSVIEKIKDKFSSNEKTSKINIDNIIEKYAINIADKKDTKMSTRQSKISNQSKQESFIINFIPPEGININKPGKYKFGNNIKWYPDLLNDEISAIYITSNDVELDFNGYYLKNKNKNNKKKISGINVDNVSNIKIKNGYICNMIYYGIYVINGENIEIKDMEINGIFLDNLDERLLTPAGIFMNGILNFIIDKCIVKNFDVRTDSSAGIQILNSFEGEVKNCLVRDLINNDGACQGYSYLGCIQINTSKCQVKNLRTYFNGNILTSGHTILGFCPIICIDLKYNECRAENFYGSCDDCHGMSIFIDFAVEVNNFYASNIFDGVSGVNTGAKATGLEVYGVDVKISDSYVENIIAVNPQDKQSTGFSVAGGFVEFKNCTAKRIKVVDECGCSCKKLGYGTGFGWAPDPRPEFREIEAFAIEYKNCKTYDSQVGFDTWFHIDSLWKDIEVYNCKIPILIETNGKRTISCNPCSECNPPIVVTLDNVAENNSFINPKVYN